jgi:hypothetical protein
VRSERKSIVSQSDKPTPLGDGAFAEAMLQSDDVRVDASRAYGAFVARSHMRREAARRFVFLAAVAASLLVICTIVPVGSYARQFLAIFEPREFVPLYISRSDRRALAGTPTLNDLGTGRVNTPMSRVRKASAEAIADAGFDPKLPPAALASASTVAYYFLPAGHAEFTFQRSRVAAYERHSGRHLPAMPENVDGTLVRVTSGPGAVVEYKRSNGQQFSIIELRAPAVTSSGASMATIENYLASMPGVPHDVSKQLSDLASPASMLPVPIQADKNTARTESIAGAQALVIGDQTGLGSALVWRSNDIVYVVGGSIAVSEAKALANGIE